MLLVVGVAIALVRMNWKLALLSLVMLPVLDWRAVTFGQAIRPMHRAVQDEVAWSPPVQDNVAGVRVVKAFGQESARSSASTPRTSRSTSATSTAARADRAQRARSSTSSPTAAPC